VTRSAVTVSLVEEARGGPFVFWHDLPHACHVATELGFDALEIFPPSADELTKPLVRRVLDEHGLKLAAVGTGAGWVRHKLTLTNPATVKDAKPFVRSIIDAAGAFGAPAIIGSMQGRFGDSVTKDAALEMLAESLAELGEHARQYGVPLLYEPLNRYETNLVNTVEAGVALLKGMGTPNVKLLCDLFHMNIEEANLPSALRAAGPWLGHVHFVDSNRRPAGLGHLDFAPIAAVLRHARYDGYLSAEALPYPDSDQAARMTAATFQKFFR
jgi:sugar phosphate isomerase/epimerase